MSQSVIILLGFIVGIVIVLGLITIHEFGHFIVAKLAKAYVYEFSIGFGPRLFTIKGKETWLSIRLIPLGGYCSIASDKVDPPKDREDIEIPSERKLDYIKRWKKLIFIVFGPLMNLFLALTIFTLTFAITQQKPVDANWVGANYQKDKIAWKLLDASDTKLNEDEIYVLWGWKLTQAETQVFNNIDINQDDELSQKYILNEVSALTPVNYLKTATTFNASIAELQKKYKDVETDTFSLQLAYKAVNKFSGTTTIQTVSWTNSSTSKEYKLGDLIGLSAPTRFFKNSTVAYGYGWKETFTQSLAVIKSVGMIFTGRFSSLAGPVGIAGQTASMFVSGQQFILYVGVLSANLFILNMLFIPPLDGFKTLEILVEMVIRKELPTKLKIVLYSIGAVLFALLFITVTVFDFMR